MDKKPVVLSKSKYLEGLQCPKLLWYEYNRKKDLPAIDAATQAIFDEGHRVGEYAQKLFPDGVRIEPLVSEPIANGTSPAATAAPGPLEEPPLQKRVFHGLKPGPVNAASAWS